MQCNFCSHMRLCVINNDTIINEYAKRRISGQASERRKALRFESCCQLVLRNVPVRPTDRLFTLTVQKYVYLSVKRVKEVKEK